MVVGLTGGIGSGKTTVAHYFEELGAALFIADVEAKKLMIEDGELIKSITQLFGIEAYKDGQLNREFIASVVFKEAAMLQELNNLVHPKVRARFEKFKNETNAKIIIYEAAILFESGSDKICDYIITVTANYNQRIERILKRDNTSTSEIEKRIQHQLNDTTKIIGANFVIYNNELTYTKQQTASIYKMLLSLVKY